MVFDNGTINGGLDYEDLCKEEHATRIAFNNDYVFKVRNNQMLRYPRWKPIVLNWGQISTEDAIMRSFFSKYNIKPTWINCNYNWGVFDDETGHWTGAVGQVLILTLFARGSEIYV